MWFRDEIERVAQALVLANDDPQFRAGVAALAHALGATNVRIAPGMPTIGQLTSGRRVVEVQR